jgi:inositol-hexakisphosphate kinase
MIPEFILLENLTSKFKFPCVMDLKMGVRQYDDDATQSKKLSHKLKVAETTSGVLGLRITGIQVSK